MEIDKKRPEPRLPGELSSVLYRIRAQEQVLRERVIRASLRPKPKLMPERLYQYLVRKLFVVTEGDAK